METTSRDKIDELLKRAEELLPELPEVEFQVDDEKRLRVDGKLSDEQASRSAAATSVSELFRRQLGLLGDIQLEISVELGRTSMYLEDVARLRRGSVVALDRYAGESVDVLVNGRLIARGELMVVDGNFSVRLTEFV